MPESEKLNEENYRFIIYHGYLHVLSKCDDDRAEDEEAEKIKFTPST
jgi:hypothetical protein